MTSSDYFDPEDELVIPSFSSVLEDISVGVIDAEKTVEKTVESGLQAASDVMSSAAFMINTIFNPSPSNTSSPSPSPNPTISRL